MGRAALIVHGGAGDRPVAERPRAQAAVEAALEAGWAAIAQGALAAAVAAVRLMEDAPLLNAGLGACLNAEGVAELDAAVMLGDGLRAGAVGAVRDVRHPVDLALEVMEEGRHVLLVGDGASRFAAERGVELSDPEVFVAARRAVQSAPSGDTVGAVARDAGGALAVAVSTGGLAGKRPGRIGDSPLLGAGLYADDEAGAACATGVGEGFIRTVLCHRAVERLAAGDAAEVAGECLELLARRVGGRGGLILLGREGAPAAAWNTPHMTWAMRVTGD
ncbi:MAG TPA: isoaspartyl peptidase/L-asparaginase [Candidatus Dormibacteraeota bacterium]|nr:isoaspartyl peptidase/L-asparaginase [Candidatus Dormibacteraeota bacterium]